MSFKYEILFALLNISVLPILAHQENVLEDVIEYIAENGDAEIDLSELTEHYENLRRQPLNINKVSREELESLVFLTNLQITLILDHRTRNGYYLDLLELQTYKAFDKEKIEWLNIFLKVYPEARLKPPSELLREGRHELTLRTGGSLDLVRSPNYATGLKLLTRYRYTYRKDLSVSFNSEKDAGELVNLPKGRFMDFYSAHASYRGDGTIRKLVLGDYSLQFGQGLNLWTGNSFGKGALLFNLAKPEVGLKGYTSLNESSFFRGVALNLGLKGFSLTPFFSYRKIDASVSAEGSINAISVSGLHRTESELKNKGSTSQTAFGSDLNFTFGKVRMGSTVYHTRYDRPFAPGASAYQKFNLSGDRFLHMSIYFRQNLHRNYVFGEAAHIKGFGYGLLAGLMRTISDHVSSVILIRSYDKDFHSPFGNAVSEGSRPSNERGLLAGIQFHSASKWEGSLYFDAFKFPWMRYRVDGPSSGYEILSQLRAPISARVKLLARLKISSKQENTAQIDQVRFLDQVEKANFRLEFNYKWNDELTLRQRSEISRYRKGTYSQENGFLIYCDLIYSPLLSNLSGNARIAYSSIPGFNSRIYSYQNDVAYAYTIPAYQGKGVSCYFNTRLSLGRSLDLWGRYAFSALSEKDTDEEEHKPMSIMQTFNLQLRLKF